MQTLFERNNRLLARVSTEFVRSLMNDIAWQQRLIGIRGARGVGKTTLLLQYQLMLFGMANPKALYCSLDHPYFLNHTLLETAEQFDRQGGECLLLDEVHKYPHWSREIKNIYDSIPTLKVVFTGSSLLEILNAEADLSRRCLSYVLPVLSFREYLTFFHQLSLPRLTLPELLEKAAPLCADINRHVRPLQFFSHYLQQGCYPFGKEDADSYEQRLQAVADLILQMELPELRKVEMGNVRKIKALLVTLANNVPMLVDTTRLAMLTGISRPTVLTYLQYLQQSGLIRLLYSDELSVKKMQKPDKVLLGDSNLLYAFSQTSPLIGTVRETFLCSQLAYQHSVEYTKKGDFLIDKQFTIEVGGQSKDGKQIASVPDAYIAADDTEYAFGNKLPLWLFGLLY